MNVPSANDMYRVAQMVARTGQPVFPCKVRGEKAKAPLIRHGLNAASCDRAQIKQWWSEHRGAAVGIPTGVLWDVLDVDVKSGQDGRAHLPYLHTIGLLNGCQRVVRTPSGGLHLYFRAASGLTNKARVALGLDVRAKGGYVLAPQSYLDAAVSSTGEVYSGLYETLCDAMGDTMGATDDPLYWDLIQSALAPVNTLTKQPVVLLDYERRASLASLRGWLSERVPGERNNALHWAVCRCIENGIDPNELTEVALVALDLGEDEVALTINSALRRAGIDVDDLDSEAEALFPETEFPDEN